ncbi:hypothetical protein Moror_8561 [Moniliophthora roreri MCA 2997]|uniref:Uncharacterized protein n=1 Tax=Moniliophthora roreri (strain MCA 2997) TaxID=1381753 RepID=V2WQF2_MONRO|nr:hypothetical protein Moror_8561 [Moniliophthora roreri MCA 2997]
MRFNLEEWLNKARNKIISVIYRALLPEELLVAPVSFTALAAIASIQREGTNLSSALPMNSLSTPVDAVKGRISAVRYRRPPPDVLQVGQGSTSMIGMDTWHKHPNNIMNGNHINGPTMFALASGFTITGGTFNNIVSYGFNTITIIDPAGRSFSFPPGVQPQQESIGDYLKWLFQHPEARDKKISDMLSEFVGQGQYSLSIDEGRQVIMLGSEEEQ